MISKIIEGDKTSKLQHYISTYTKVVITTHVSPDGDALGSSLGLYHYLESYGVQATIIVPNKYPEFFKWMPGIENVVVYEENKAAAELIISKAEVIYCLDYNAPSRTRFLEELLLTSGAKKVMIDHHPDPSDFCNITLSYPELSSTCETLFRIICKMGDFDRINRPCAEAIYTGMMTDTGGFIYNSNNSEIYFIVSQLIEKGINKDQIYSNVYNNYSEDRYRMLGYALSEKMKVYPKYHSALIYINEAEQRRFNAKKGDTEGFANLPLNIKDIRFAGFVREDGDQVKISLRSQGSFPTNKFAGEYYNGGGHLNASGGEYKGSLEDAVKLFEEGIVKYAELLIDNNN